MNKDDKAHLLERFDSIKFAFGTKWAKRMLKEFFFFGADAIITSGNYVPKEKYLELKRKSK